MAAFSVMDYSNSPFHRFQGWHILILLTVTFAYTYWFVVIGPFSKLATLAPGLPLEERGFYTGAQAVEALSGLGAEGTRAKFISLACDVPYMILTALSLEALIAFGIRRLNFTNVKWNFLFILPIAFLLFDFAEDSFLALTLATDSTLLGSIAGILTPLKLAAVIPATIIAVVMGVTGLIAWGVQSLRR